MELYRVTEIRVRQKYYAHERYIYKHLLWLITVVKYDF